MRRAAMSMRGQISSASGTNNSPCGVSITRSGVPETLSRVEAEVEGPGDLPEAARNCTSLLVIDTPQGELLVALAEDICPRSHIDAPRREATIPAGPCQPTRA